MFAPLSVQLSCLLVGPCTRTSRAAQKDAFRSLWRGGLGDHVSFLLDTFLLRDAGMFGFVREATSASPAEAVGSTRLAQSLTATLQGMPPPAGLTLVSVAFVGERGGAGAAGLLELVRGICIETHYSHPFRFVFCLCLQPLFCCVSSFSLDSPYPFSLTVWSSLRPCWRICRARDESCWPWPLPSGVWRASGQLAAAARGKFCPGPHAPAWGCCIVWWPHCSSSE